MKQRTKNREPEAKHDPELSPSVSNQALTNQSQSKVHNKLLIFEMDNGKKGKPRMPKVNTCLEDSCRKHERAKITHVQRQVVM